MKGNVRTVATAIGVVALVVVAWFGWRFFVRFLPFVPRERITISLPFAKEDDDLIFINPMGETVEHPDAPSGHPGLDFGWHHPAPLRAVAEGKITKIAEHKSGGHGETEKVYDVEIVSGVYAVRYSKIAPAEHLSVGMRVQQGDVIGRGGEYKQPGGLGTYYSTHWEFDYDTFWYDRLCPMSYFTPESRERITAIWANVGQTYNGRFPDICSGGYKGKDR